MGLVRYVTAIETGKGKRARDMIDGAGLMRKLYHVRVGAREIARERISWGKIDAGIDKESDQSFKILTFRVNQMSQCFL